MLSSAMQPLLPRDHTDAQLQNQQSISNPCTHDPAPILYIPLLLRHFEP